MDYEGGDLLLADRMAGCRFSVQTLGGDLKTAWLSFRDENALEVSVTQDALYKSTSYLYVVQHVRPNWGSHKGVESGGGTGQTWLPVAQHYWPVGLRACCDIKSSLSVARRHSLWHEFLLR